MNVKTRGGSARAVLAVIMMLAMMLTTFTGCVNNTDGPSEPSAKPDAPSAAPEQSTKDTVIIGTPYEPTAFICQDSTYVTNSDKDGVVYNNIYETLFYIDLDGVVQPRLATGYEASEDGMEYTVTIREDVTFHNGDKMTAEDVAFTFNLCLEKNKNHSGTMLVNLQSAEVVDATHVKLKLKAPYAAFIKCLTTRPGNVISKAYYEQVGSEGYNENPIGTGPYKYVSRISGQEIVLEAYEGYYGGEVSIKNVIIRPISNISTQFISLESGDIDVISSADISSCLKIKDDSIATWNALYGAKGNAIYFNTRPTLNSPMKDLNLRKAIQAAVNKEEILLGAYSGYGEIMESDALSWYSGLPDPGTYTTVAYDIEKAKEYLAASSFDTSKSLKAIATSGTEEDPVFQIIQGQLQEIGITLDVVVMDSATQLAAWNAGDYDMLMKPGTFSLGDIGGINQHYTTNATRGDPFEPTEQEWFNEAINAMNMEMDVTARKQLAGEILGRVNEMAYSLPLFATAAAIAYNKDLQGVSLDRMRLVRINEWSWS